jgi:uroporphyrinogen decarboxylase
MAVLANERPDRATLFEFFLNGPLYRKLSGFGDEANWGTLGWQKMSIAAFAEAGYDYATAYASNFRFPAKEVEHQASRSMNDTAIISDRASFEAYPWPEPGDFETVLDDLKGDMRDGMRLIVPGPGGLLENVMALVGYEPLCYMLFDDTELAEDIFSAVGSRLVRYYELVAPNPLVGALIVNDDWGFNTQTMLPPDEMRRYVFPWHKRMVEAIHAQGKPAILHSCGNLADVMDDIIDDMRYDAKHSYEDKIIPVEDAYELWGGRIAILGGIDLDFVCRSRPEDITSRCRAMLARAEKRGGYALGTGNSVPEYVPDENYFAMIGAAID